MAPPLTAPTRCRVAALVVALAFVASACSGGDDDVAILSLGEPTGSFDVQAEIDPDAVVDVPYATLDGGQGNLTDFAGTPLVVNFFAAWCASCVSEMPDFQATFEDRGGEIAFLGISEDARASDSLELIDETGISYPTGWDPDGEIFASFGSFTMPTTLFIDADGTIVEMFSGALSRERLDSLIDEHLV